MKSVTLATFVNNRNNNFNLLRFLAALAVLYSHCYPAAGVTDKFITQFGFGVGSIAVDIFFITSGFLVTNSLLSRYDLLFFTSSRLLRIIPGLFVSLIFCVFIVGPIFTTLPLKTYLLHRQTIVFFCKNLILFLGEVGQLPGVFEQNPYRGIVNASLWTLPWEVRMYAALALIGLVSYRLHGFAFQKLAKRLVTLLVTTALLLYWLNYYMPFASGIIGQLVHLTSMFFLGSAFFVYRDRIVLTTTIFLVCVLVLGLFSFTTNLLFIPYTLIVGYLVFYLAFIPKGFIRQFNQLPDYSYGLYIYGFPVQQSIAFLYHDISLTTMLLLSTVITFVLAALSWHFVEEPALALKKYALASRLKVAKSSGEAYTTPTEQRDYN